MKTNLYIYIMKFIEQKTESPKSTGCIQLGTGNNQTLK